MQQPHQPCSQKISERLRETLRFYQPEPPSLFIRLWHVMNGSLLAAFLSLLSTLLRFAERFLIPGTDVQSDPFSLVFMIGMFAISFPMFYLSTGRRNYVRVSNSAIAAAESIEKKVDYKRMQKMMKLTRLSKRVFVLYFAEGVSDVVMIISLWYSSPGPQLSLLPADLSFFRRIYYLELVLFPMGIIAGVSFIAYHLEMALCLTCLYNILGELFREAPTQEGVDELVRIHQLLLNASKMFQEVFSIQWFSFLITVLAVVIVATLTVIHLSFRLSMIFLTASLFEVLCRACIFGEMIAMSSSDIGFAVYQKDWVYATPAIRRDLSLVILRSQKPVHCTAGFLGKLNLVKLASIVNSWYKFVQALLNILTV